MNNTSELASPNNTPQLDAFTKVVEHRRAVRVFKETEIPRDVMDECLRLAMLAPSSSNLQPWEFYVIESKDKRQTANKLCMGQNAAKTANKLVAVVARTDTWSQSCKKIIDNYPAKPVPKVVLNYYEKIIPFGYALGPANVLSLAKAAVFNAHRVFKGPIANPIYGPNDLKNWATNNAYLAAENFMLAMRAHGFDTCPIGGFDEPAMKKLLKLNRNQHIVMMVGCGERSEKGIYSAQYRFDFDEHVFRV